MTEIYNSENRTNVKMADEGKLQKMEVDYSSTVDEKIPECVKMSKVSP